MLKIFEDIDYVSKLHKKMSDRFGLDKKKLIDHNLKNKKVEPTL